MPVGVPGRGGLDTGHNEEALFQGSILQQRILQRTWRLRTPGIQGSSPSPSIRISRSMRRTFRSYSCPSVSSFHVSLWLYLTAGGIGYARRSRGVVIS